MPGGIPEYDELKLRVEPRGGGTYDVVAFAQDGGTATGRFESPISQLELDNFILRVASPRSVRAYRSSHMEEAKQLGGELFEHLLAEDVGDLYQGARRVAGSKKRGLRISLYMTGAPELLEIPWELLYDPSEAFFLSQSIYTPVVRSLDLKSPPASPKVTLPLQVLALVSAPEGFPPLDTDAERAKLEQALSPLVESGAVRLDWLQSATLSELDRRIGAPDELHVIHYIGHGAYDKRTEEGILVLEDARGGPHEVTGEELGTYMRDELSLRLVVLNSCEGARASHVDPFSGVAASLLRCGLPAVIGMQAEITDVAAITFSDRLYTALAQGFPIDAALAQARRAIFAAGGDVEFGTPVLFMRVADGRIFDLSGAPPPPPVGRPEAALYPEPEVCRSGGTVAWHLQIKNAGRSRLSEVTARDQAGETRAGPLTLDPDATHESTWTATVESDTDERVTIGCRGSDGRLVSAQADGHVTVSRRGWRERLEGLRPSKPLLAAAAALVALAVVLLVVMDGDDTRRPDVRVFNVGTDVSDLDARADKVAFLVPLPIGTASFIKRLDLPSGRTEDVTSTGPRFNGIDVGLDSAGHALLVYSRCDASDRCAIYTKRFNGKEKRLTATGLLCNEIRPSMSRGVLLFAEVGGICQPDLLLKPAGGADARSIGGATLGSDLNDGSAVWLTPAGTLVAKRVTWNAQLRPAGALEPGAGASFHAPLVVEDAYAYFVHEQRSKNFIARAKLPLGDSKIEHYSRGEDEAGSEEAPHFAVTGDTLYITNYPQPNGEPGSRVIVRVRNPTFEPAE